MTNDRKNETQDLTADQLDAATGGITLESRFVTPLEARGFNPQPDPPARQIKILSVG